MSDLISRQAAIEAVCNVCSIVGDFHKCDGYPEGSTWCEEITALRALPSAEPEIIHCGDCKYKDDGIDEDGIPFLKCLAGRSYGGTRINDFCSWAERRRG